MRFRPQFFNGSSKFLGRKSKIYPKLHLLSARITRNSKMIKIHASRKNEYQGPFRDTSTASPIHLSRVSCIYLSCSVINYPRRVGPRTNIGLHGIRSKVIISVDGDNDWDRASPCSDSVFALYLYSAAISSSWAFCLIIIVIFEPVILEAV